MPADVIAIDGPAASGKSTIAKGIAKKLDAAFVSTGAMYRAVAWKAINAGIDPDKVDEKALRKVLDSLQMSYEPAPGGSKELMVDGQFLAHELRSPEVSANASKLATLPIVRERMAALQRAMAGRGLIVMEGRDIGTVVFPDAKYKFFLTASPMERARRRLAQEGESKDGATVESVAKEIEERDCLDMSRAIAPLKKADDATLVDSSGMQVEEVLQKILEEIKSR